MLSGDGGALQFVNFVDFLDNVLFHPFFTAQAEHFRDIGGTVGQKLSFLYFVACLAERGPAERHDVFHLVLFAPGRALGQNFDYFFLFLVRLYFQHLAIGLGNDSRIFGHASFEYFLHARQTCGDVGTGDASGVESSKRELSAGFADSLCRDNANRFPFCH